MIKGKEGKPPNAMLIVPVDGQGMDQKMEFGGKSNTICWKLFNTNMTGRG